MEEISALKRCKDENYLLSDDSVSWVIRLGSQSDQC